MAAPVRRNPAPIHCLNAWLERVEAICSRLRVFAPVTDWPDADAALHEFQLELRGEHPTPVHFDNQVQAQALGVLVSHGLTTEAIRSELGRVVGFLSRFAWANLRLPHWVVGNCRELAQLDERSLDPAEDWIGDRASDLRGMVFSYRRGVEEGANERSAVPHLREQAISPHLAEAGELRGIVMRWLAEIERGEGGKSPRWQPGEMTLEKAEIIVRNWLAEHAKEDPEKVTRDGIAEATEVSAGLVSRTTAWRTFRDLRADKRKRPVREVPFTDAMQAVIPADCETPEQLALLIEEQNAEEAEQARRHKHRHERRHGPS